MGDFYQVGSKVISGEDYGFQIEEEEEEEEEELFYPDLDHVAKLSDN
ncbi:hypothetical protein ACFS3C_20500 [Azotobacter vinelandii]|nr:hypothetical protein [Azotobacter vinelandii]WKN20957.1 hypothetical protein AVAEIV_003990 [Azotobacter vinelandii]GLK62058.1 hypothetical protein GCM10017624_42220 [Azotobacter vinelandii]SFX20574.1 hypothetical protein SAMN04244547_00756 [Azotobacter vinelandii]